MHRRDALPLFVFAACLGLTFAAARPSLGHMWHNQHGGPPKCHQQGGPGSLGGCSSCGTYAPTSSGSPVDEVNTFNGDLTITDTPVSYKSVGDAFPFTITYNADYARPSSMGSRWSHSYNTYVINDAPYGVTVIESNGWENYFSGDPAPGSPYVSPAWVTDTLEKTYQMGNWNGWRLTRASQEYLTFNTSGQLTRRTDTQGISWTFTYTSGLLTTATDPKGRQTTLSYTNGNLTQVTVPGNLHAHFGYDTSTPPRLTTVTDAADYDYSYGYDASNRVVSIVDPSGRQVEYTYYADGKLETTFITGLPSSAKGYSYTPQPNGQLYVDITETKDGQNRVTRHVYENTDDPTNGRYIGTILSIIKDVGGIAATQGWAYDSNFRKVRYRDSYQPETGGKAHRHFYYYTDANNPTLVTKYIDPENSDANPSDTGTPSPDCPGYLYEYDSRGNKTKETTPEGRVTDYTYYAGTSRLYQVIIRDQDVNGNPVDRTTSYTYWDVTYRFQVKTITDARGNVTTYYYDSNCYLDYIDPPLGNNIQYTCNAVGDVTAVTDGNGNTTSYQYDGIHRQTQITYPDIGAGQKTKTTSYSCCDIDQVTDENGIVTKYEYDQYTHRLWKVHEDYAGLNYVTEYGYDEVGNQKTVKNARGKTTSYTWDDADRKTRADYPDATYETWTYRDDGRVWTHTDGRGRTVTYRYDADDRPAGSGSYKAIDYPNDTDVQITRDEDGLITQVVDASGTTTNVYYPSQWLKTTTVSAGASKTITYQYNGMGLVSDMAVSGESSFTYGYNARNQPDTITNPNSVAVSFTYDNGGRRTRVTRPGSYIEYVYNARDWITEVRNRTIGGVTRYDATYYYQDGALWDHTGNPLKRTENLAGSTYNTTFRYDHVYRQTEETKRDSGNNVVYSLGYGYDQVGNRTTRTLGGVTITYVYDNNDKMSSASGGGQSATFGYDNNGNMTSVSGTLYGSKTFVYNDDNRLTSLTYGGVTDLYHYKHTGQRYRARLNGTYYRYLYNGERVLEELNDTGTMQARYTTENDTYYGQWLHLYRPSGSLSRFPMYDNIGSARGLLDASGTATDWYELDTFGRQVSSSGTTPNPYRFGAAWGYITDPSAFLQLGHRFYWPEVGRFVSQDPITGATSRYGYANNDPLTRADPSGQEAQCLICLGCVASVVADVAGGCAAGCYGAPMGFWNCVAGCLDDVMTCQWWKDLPEITKGALWLCGGICATCLPELAGGAGKICQPEPCPLPEPPPIWKPGDPLPPDFPVRPWP